jgi:CarD family transcriptional regulator
LEGRRRPGRRRLRLVMACSIRHARPGGQTWKAQDPDRCQAPIWPLTCVNTGIRTRRSVLDWSPRKGYQYMTFTVGETVVYPNHGAAVIEDIETRQIKGEDKQYLVLRIVAQQDLVVRVPACNLDLVGVRDVVDKEGLDRVFDVLRAAHTEEPTNWSRRYKANLEKLHSGDVMKVAEVVRDLWRRERDRGLSAGEKRMLAKARQILVSELALAEHTNEDKAESLLDDVLAS